MKSVYPVQIIKTVQKEARVSFSDKREDIPGGLKITPMVFCFLNGSVVLSLDKTDEWNAQCGHRNDNESVEDCLVREAYEEAGVSIDSLFEVGSMKYETYLNTERKYPPVTYIPVFIARVTKIAELPEGSEVKGTVIANHKKAQSLLSERNDNKLLLSIYNRCRKQYHSNVTTS